MENLLKALQRIDSVLSIQECTRDEHSKMMNDLILIKDFINKNFEDKLEKLNLD